MAETTPTGDVPKSTLSKNVMLVDIAPSSAPIIAVERALSRLARVEVLDSFAKARLRLLSDPTPDLLITNVRLGSYSDLHVWYLAQTNESIRAVVYSDRHDPIIQTESMRAGAFYEPLESLPFAVSSYLSRDFSRERRLKARDRRATVRGGRRRAD